MTNGKEEDFDLRRVIFELQTGAWVEVNSRRVFELFYPWVRRFFARLGHTPQDSEDLAQETFSQVFERIGSFRHDGSFKSWLFAVAANLHRNDYRRRHREKRSTPEISIDTSPDADVSPPEPASPEAAPDRAVYARERREALARAMEGLPPQMRQVLALRVDQDLKYREIAAVLQISVETVKAHLFQARQRLRAELGEGYGEWGD
ncbi:MAG TPA: RNA polymerase sigma factor [Thermoanaerobaculia bacterium]|nr:RNA polymerase sigma factor [Thermoanaerobaculia bacterium]